MGSDHQAVLLLALALLLDGCSGSGSAPAGLPAGTFDGATFDQAVWQ